MNLLKELIHINEAKEEQYGLAKMTKQLKSAADLMKSKGFTVQYGEPSQNQGFINISKGKQSARIEVETIDELDPAAGYVARVSSSKAGGLVSKLMGRGDKKSSMGQIKGKNLPILIDDAIKQAMYAFKE